MDDLLTTLERLDAELASVAGELGGVSAMPDAGVLELLSVSAGVQRRAEALQAAAVARVDARSHAAVPRDERMTTRHGARTVGELVQRVTRGSRVTAHALLAAARAGFGERDVVTGVELAPAYPEMAAAFRDGVVGVDGLLAVARVLGDARGRIPRDARDAAEGELAAAARGAGADGRPAVDADELKQMAHVWLAFLDPDGAEPRADDAARHRAFQLGRERNGLVHVWGDLQPDVAAQLQLLFDAILSPAASHGPCFESAAADGRSDGGGAGGGSDGSGALDAAGGGLDAPGDGLGDGQRDADGALDAPDPRTRAQKQHDALATLLMKVAGSGTLPTLGGAAPTLVVWAREDDLATGRGVAHLPGQDAPVPLSSARRVGCEGTILRIGHGPDGQILSLTTTDRVFNRHQRRAIAARDGTCVIPGCRVPASWCEIHHVTEHSRGGPTTTGNGVALCWHHHHTIDSGVWQIRMRDGVPEIRGPSWWDASRQWHPLTTSPLRTRDRLGR